MHEIKFRAWEPDLKRYYYFDLYTLYCINPNKVTLPGRNETNAMILFNINHRPQEQFTGLHDNNGKEIYEGDIVYSETWNPKKYIVVFDRGGFCLKYDDSGYYPDIKYAENMDVVGNIHENPELMK